VQSFGWLAHSEDAARVQCRCCLKQGFIGVKLCENVRAGRLAGCVQNLIHNAQAARLKGVVTRCDPPQGASATESHKLLLPSIIGAVLSVRSDHGTTVRSRYQTKTRIRGFRLDDVAMSALGP
jgi:hypothetical protein